MKLFNVLLPEHWLPTLRQIAREQSATQRKDVTVSSMIRELLQEKFKLEEKQSPKRDKP
ncbi:unnamed protein product [marine sediment metagenome]|uniref:Uncharacterized protein n=1 Tax=marine sediment metagenome TaxID=412755 RepID=X0UXE9_9ZZZZ